MAIDYARFVGGLAEVAAIIGAGEAELAAIDALVRAVRDASGAAGATFTEYGGEGGRVVVAHGDMAFALGQPIGPEFVEDGDEARPWSSPVEVLPAEVAEPLLSRGAVAIAGQPVRSRQRLIRALHLFFGELDPGMWERTEPVLRVAAACAAHVYSDRDNASTAVAVAAADDDRTLFLAVAGHELRTPVTVLKGYASMLSDRWESLDELDRRASARVLAQRADDLARLVDRLLDASVDESASWLVRTVPFDPLETLMRAAAALPAELRRVVRVELPNSLPPASGDPAILTSVVTELVTNAFRATQQVDANQLPTSTVELQAGADAHTVFVRVCDRGVGIDPAHAERAFERFWRARRGGESRGGVGLGLYLVRRLIERQNGWVSLRARDGGGTVAEVRLQRADDPLRPSPFGEA